MKSKTSLRSFPNPHPQKLLHPKEASRPHTYLVFLTAVVPHIGVNIEKWPSISLADGADASSKQNLGILSQSLSLTPHWPSSRKLEVCVVFLQFLVILCCHWRLGMGRTSHPKRAAQVQISSRRGSAGGFCFLPPRRS